MAYASFSFQDSYGRRTTKRIELQPQTLLADYETVLTAMVGHLDAVTDLALVRVDLTFDGIVSGFAEDATCNVDVGGTFSGTINGGNGKKASFKLPGVKSSFVQSDGSILVSEGDAIQTLLSWFEDGQLEYAYLSDGEEIDTWLKGSLDK